MENYSTLNKLRKKNLTYYGNYIIRLCLCCHELIIRVSN